jgi:oligopeptide transport system permease protein
MSEPERRDMLTVPAEKAVTEHVEPERGTSLWKDAYHRLRKNRLAMAGLVVLAAMAVIVVAGPWVSPYGFAEQNRENAYATPSFAHWFGTDGLGRDMMVRVFMGGRVSLLVGLAGTAVSLLIGVTFGATAGFVGGHVENVMMRVVDILYALPFTIFAIILVTIFERSLVLVFLAVGAVEWLTMARIVRGQILSLKEKEFIEAANALGYGRRRILFRHLIPNALGPIIVYATLTVPKVMLVEAFLSYLGLGVQAPMSSWGSLIKEGTAGMEEFPHLLLFPSLFLTMTLFSLNFLGDGLRDALDPRSSKD